MMIVDYYDDKCFTAIDLKNRKAINRFGIEGRGPNELSFPLNLHYNKNEHTVSFTNLNPFRYWYLDADKITRNEIPFSEKVRFEGRSHNYFTLTPIHNSKGMYFGTGMFPGGMYGISNSEGILDTIIGHYTVAEEHMSIDPFLLGAGYQGIIAPKPDAPLVAYASFSHDLIEVIDCSESDFKIKRFHGGNYPQLRVEKNNMAMSKNSQFYFLDLCTTDKCIYALYSGKTYAKDGGMAENCKFLYVFDWNLKPIVCYELDYEITSIKVSEDDQILYSFALNMEDNMVLMKWQMNH